MTVLLWRKLRLLLDGVDLCSYPRSEWMSRPTRFGFKTASDNSVSLPLPPSLPPPPCIHLI